MKKEREREKEKLTVQKKKLFVSLRVKYCCVEASTQIKEKKNASPFEGGRRALKKARELWKNSSNSI